MKELSDQEREQMIAQKGMELQTAKSPEARRAAWEELQRLIKGRSRQQISRMEQNFPAPPGVHSFG